jgi:hypothetical protein
LPAAWEAAGYTLASSNSGFDAWSLGGPDDFDFDHPIQGAVLSDFNNVAILNDSLLVYTADAGVLAEVAATYQLGSGSAVHLQVTQLLVDDLPIDTVSCFLMKGEDFDVAGIGFGSESEPWRDWIAQSDQAVGHMPPWIAMSACATAGIKTEDRESASVVNPSRLSQERPPFESWLRMRTMRPRSGR